MPRTLPTFEEVISTLPLQKLAVAVVGAIENRYGYDDVTADSDRVPRPYRLVHVVLQTTGFLGTNGLHSLLQLPCRMTYTTYLAELGFTEVANKVRRYVRWRLVFSNASTYKVEQLLYRHNEMIYDSVGQYIIANARKFKSLLPAMRETLAYLEQFDPEGYEKKLSEPDPRIEWMRSVTEGLRSGEIDVEDAIRQYRDGP